MVSKEESMAIIKQLQEFYSIRQIAEYMDKHYITIHRWKHGTNVPSIGEYRNLQAVLREKQKGVTNDK